MRKTVMLLLAALISIDEVRSQTTASEPPRLTINGQALQPSDADRKHPLWNVCEGEWQEVLKQAIGGPAIKDSIANVETQKRARCLLDEIGRRNRSNDPLVDEFLRTSDVQAIVTAFGEPGFDFFASEARRASSTLVRDTVDANLLTFGYPPAIEQYFAVRRQRLARHEDWKRDDIAAVGRFGPMLREGRCGSALCSSRITESLRVLAANLDVLDFELAGVESVNSEERRAQARELRGVIARIRRGEATVGAISK